MCVSPCARCSASLPGRRPDPGPGETGQPGQVAIRGAHLVPALTSQCPHPPPGSLPVWDAVSSGCCGSRDLRPCPDGRSRLLCGCRALGASPRAGGLCPRGHLRGPDVPQAAPRVSTASIAARSATVPTGAAATASMGPASATPGSTAASATWVSPLACGRPAARRRAVTLCRTAAVWLGGDLPILRMRTGGLSGVPWLERGVLPGSMDSTPCPLNCRPPGCLGGWSLVL